LSICDEHLLLTSRITEEKRNTRTTTDFKPLKIVLVKSVTKPSSEGLQ